jgi:ubiquitin carboxyl-terminal hydrolase 25/28
MSHKSGKDEDSVAKKRIESGRQLIRELKKLFAKMAMGNKKYIDPSGVLYSIVDNFGQKVQIGEEKDIREFNDVLLARISDAFKAKQSLYEMGQEMGDGGSNPNDAEPTHDLQLQKESSFTAQPEEIKHDKPKVTKQEDQFVHTFEGKLTTIINFHDKEGRPGQKVVHDTFSDVLLNVPNSKDFYAVWDGEYCTTIDNFAVEDNVFVKAEKVDWI